jgi:2-polyprenyl-3-methyl-5-hydroxy-6-metoxy-1,4-benzoquinol methylase
MHKEVDEEGHLTLDVISKADRFNRWMFDTISPFCKGNILEIGSGIGNISQFFIAEDRQFTLSDLRKNYCSILSDKFPSNRVIQINLIEEKFEETYSDYLETFDSIFALNVVEHIQDDQLAIQNCKKLLKPKGILIVLVPAYQFLYNELDKSLDHFRRYNRASLNAIIHKNNLTLVKSFHFNFVGILGWFVSGKILKNKRIPEGQMGLYNSLIPFIKVIDFLVLNKMGLSVISISKKNGD